MSLLLRVFGVVCGAAILGSALICETAHIGEQSPRAVVANADDSLGWD